MNPSYNQKYFLLKDECYQIVGACLAAHNEFGNTFLEPVNQEALALEFSRRGVPFTRVQKMEIYYKDALLEKKYYTDFLCYDQIVVELKACEAIHPEHISQAINYLSALKLRLALLVNFGAPRLQWKRVII